MCVTGLTMGWVPIVAIWEYDANDGVLELCVNTVDFGTNSEASGFRPCKD